MVYLALAFLVFLVLVVVTLTRAKPYPLDMEREEQRLDKRERGIMRDLQVQPLAFVAIIKDRPLSERLYKNAFWWTKRESIDDLCREALGEVEA